MIEIDLWIEELQKAIKEARKYKAALKRHQARREAELDKVHAEWVRTEFEKIDAEEQADEDEAKLSTVERDRLHDEMGDT